MRTLIAVMLFACLAYCTARADAYIPDDPSVINAPPTWAQRADTGTTCWTDGTYIYAVGSSEEMKSKNEQKVAALNLALGNLMLTLKLRTATIKDIAIRTWRSDSGALYVLIHVLPKNIIPEE